MKSRHFAPKRLQNVTISTLICVIRRTANCKNHVSMANATKNLFSWIFEFYIQCDCTVILCNIILKLKLADTCCIFESSFIVGQGPEFVICPIKYVEKQKTHWEKASRYSVDLRYIGNVQQGKLNFQLIRAPWT